MHPWQPEGSVRRQTPGIEIEDVLRQHLTRHALKLDQVDVLQAIDSVQLRSDIQDSSLLPAANRRFNHTCCDLPLPHVTSRRLAQPGVPPPTETKSDVTKPERLRVGGGGLGGGGLGGD